MADLVNIVRNHDNAIMGRRLSWLMWSYRSGMYSLTSSSNTTAGGGEGRGGAGSEWRGHGMGMCHTKSESHKGSVEWSWY